MNQEECWVVRYNEVMAYNKKEHPKPSKYYPEEKLKFHFIHHYKKLYNVGNMKPERTGIFEKLLTFYELYKRKNQYA